MSLAAGDRCGSYEILMLLGKGGMGEVYKARDTRLNRDVAVKISTGQFSERFEREARAIASLNHPNICTLFDIGPNYLVMEFVEGELLSERIKAGPIPVEESLEIARQIALALEAAHERGIVHRDLKPGNVMVKPDGSVKVLDFGLAKIGGNAPTAVREDSPTISMAATQAGIILGTAAYMAPEQARGKPVDKRADIWAFGVLLHEMVTGRQLFRGEDLTETLAAVVMKEPDLTAAPVRLRRAIARCLEKDPKKRLRDISGFELLLEDAAPGSSTVEARSRRLLPWGIAAAALVAALAAGFLLWRQPPAAAPEFVRFAVHPPEDLSLNLFVQMSPDGRWIAFSGNGSGDPRARLWVRSMDSLEAKPLPGTEGMTGGMFWLPDSRTLVFVGSGTLRKIDVHGGPPQPLCDASVTVGGGFLTPDNRIVFGTPSTAGIQACPAGGGSTQQITAFQQGGQEQFHAFPVLLPDRTHFLFWRQAGPESGIYIGSLDGKPQEQTGKRVLPDVSAPGYVDAPDGRGPGTLLFHREGTLMAQSFDPRKLELVGDAAPVAENLRSPYSFSASRNGHLAFLTSSSSTVQLTWFDSEGRSQGTVGNPFRTFSDMRISPDGTRLAAARSEPGGQSDIWVVDLETGQETKLTTDPAKDSSPVWSPDSKRIVFTSNREGTDNLYVRSADGAGKDDLLLKTGERKQPLHWSHDGNFLLFGALGPAGVDVWVLPLEPAEGERKPLPYLRSPSNKGGARFSPDGRFVAYTSDESGTVETYVRPFDPAAIEASGRGTVVKVSQGGSTGQVWTADGKEILYRSPDRKMWSVLLTHTPELRAGPPRLVSQNPLPEGNRAAAPDGRILVGVPVGGARPSIEVLLNWQTALKR